MRFLIIGILLGMALGLSIGLLTAPNAGAETRQRIRKRAEPVIVRARETVRREEAA